MCSGLPNVRLKLAAPVLNKPGEPPTCRVGRILFVNILMWRRSLSAIR